MTRPAGSADRPVPALSIPDIRDYQRINAELVQQLDQGHPRVRLVGAEGQRLLVFGLRGAWQGVVEVEGRAGPELAAELNAPGLTIVCHGPAADGAGRALRAGRLLILGDAGAGLGMAQEGGTIVAAGAAGPRAGLNQRGGDLAVLGPAARLAGDRQSGGRLLVRAEGLGPYPGRGRRGGRFVLFDSEGLDPDDAQAFLTLQHEFAPWLTSTPP